MARRAVHPGTPLREIVTSKFVNELTRSPAQTFVTAGTTYDNESVKVFGQLESGDDVIEPYEPVLINRPVQVFNTNEPNLPQETQDVPTVFVNKLSQFSAATHGWLPHWGIALGLITSTQAAPILLTGVTFFKLSGTLPGANFSTYRGIDIVNGAVTYNLFGRAEILGNLDTSKTHVLVSLTRRLRSGVCGRSINAIAAGGSGLFYLQTPTGAGGWANSAVQLTGYNRSTTVAVGANKNLVAVEADGRWVIVYAEC